MHLKSQTIYWNCLEAKIDPNPAIRMLLEMGRETKNYEDRKQIARFIWIIRTWR